MQADAVYNESFCKAFLMETCRFLYGYAEGKTNLLRYGPQTQVEEEAGENILKLRSADLTAEQIDALEVAFREVTSATLASLFTLIDGARRPSGWPTKIRIVDMDTGEAICPGELDWRFADAQLEFEENVVQRGKGKGSRSPIWQTIDE